MTFRVTCADRDTGAEYTVDLTAPSAEQATRLAAAQGHLASKAESIPEPTPGDLIAHQILQAIHHEQMHIEFS